MTTPIRTTPIWQRPFEGRYTALFTLLLSIVMFHPMVPAGISLSGVMLLGVFGIAWTLRDRGWMAWVALSAGLVGIGVDLGLRPFVHAWGGGLALPLSHLVLLTASSLLILDDVYDEPRSKLDGVAGAACVYMMIGFAFSVAFALVMHGDPAAVVIPDHLADAPRGSVAFSLSFSTITTLGYGDILPSSELARSLAAGEATLGVLFVAVTIGRLMTFTGSPDGDA